MTRVDERRDASGDDRPALSAANEETPLLADSGAVQKETVAQLKWEDVNQEVKTLGSLAWPVSAGYLLQQSLFLAPMFSLGHLGTKELAARALTTMFCNVTGYSVGFGMASALDTLCAQSLTGSSDPKAAGKHLQRGIVVMFFLSFPIAYVWWNTEWLMLTLGQEAELAHMSGLFARYSILGLFPVLINECLKRFLQSQGIMFANMVVILIVSPINMVLQYVFVWAPAFRWGLAGSAIASSISYMLLPIATTLYIGFFKGSGPWGGWEAREAFDWHQIWIFLKLGVPSVAMTCSEWWAFEILAFAAGLLGDAPLAAQAITIQSCSLTYMIPLGISVAAAARIGNALGAQAPQSAKTTAYTTLLLSLLVALVTGTAMFLMRNHWGKLWSTDPEVWELVSIVLPLGALFQISDAIGAATLGILRGSGRQAIGAVINLAGYYLVGVPVGILCAFTWGLGLVGLWIGLTGGLVTVSIIQVFIISRFDWKHEAIRALELVGDGLAPSHV
ncbi:mate-domain-containing protein [Cladochytrium replicatum]|nr:mate-domain-containing protein [Cladochytrium replicatum]